MLQNVVGGLQGIVDHAMVGHFVDFTANAAIGVSWQIYLVIVVFIASLFTGMGVLVARFTGANDPDGVNRAVYQAFLTAIFMTVLVMAPLGYLLAPGLLDLVNAEAAEKAEALPYLRIMFVFSLGNMIFFMLGGALRSAGDATTPLRLGISLTVLNVLFNVTFIAGVGPVPAMGTTGAAIGTVLAATLVSGYALVRLCGGGWVVRFDRALGWRPDLRVIRELFRFGLPTGVQGVAMNVAGVVLLGFVGSLERSAEAQAVYAVGYAQLFSLITWTSVGLLGATAAVAGQNLGAGRPERVGEAVRVASRIGVGVAIGVGLTFVLIPESLFALFGMRDPVVVALGVELLRYLTVSGLFITVALVYTGALQGTGDTRSPLHISLISQLAIPLGICWVIQTFGTLQPGHIWTAIVLGHFTRAVLSVAVFRHGRWRSIEIRVR